MIEDDTGPKLAGPKGPVFPQVEDYLRLQTFLKNLAREKQLNIEVRIAQHEAEALVSHLVFVRDVDFAITDDSDAFAFLCPQTVLH